MKRVGPFILERRLAPSRAAVIGVSVLAVLAALLVMAIIFWGYGMSP